MKEMLKAGKILIFFFLFMPLMVHAQFYSEGENPTSIRWNQINTEHFQLIFDENAEENAQKVANILTKIYEYVADNLKEEPSKISIILQNNTTVSNGFVTLAPRRSEFYTTAPQDNDVVDWLGLLAIHEFRHVVQMDKLNTGLTKILSFLLGEQGRGLTFGLTVPLWFMEGDAVGTETALTNAGRGRLPSFEREFRAQLLENGAYTYHKASFGSYKNIVPNQYPFGYFMTSYVKKHYGREVWGNVLHRVGRNPLMPFRFSTALKKEIGMGTGRLYKAMTHELDSLWKQQDSALVLTMYQPISQQKNTIPTSFHFPRVQDEQTIYAVKSGFDQIPVFVKMDSLGNESVVYQPINYEKTSFFSNGKQLLWTEKKPDPRWEYRDFSEIRIYDLQTKEVNTFLKNTKLFAPALSPDATLLTAVDYNQVGSCQLVVYDMQQKQRFFEYSAGWNEQIKNPYWLNNEEIVFIHFSSKGNAIKSININTQKITEYVAHQAIFMANPVADEKYIYFQASFSGIDNIYAVDRQTKAIFQVSNSQYGAVEVSVLGQHLYYSDYTNTGYRVVKMAIDKSIWKPIETVENTSIHYYESLAKQEGNQNLLAEIPANHFEVKRYYKWQHLVNVHSWQPVSVNSDDDIPVLGVELKSQNKLSSTILHYRYQDVSTKNLKKHEMDITYNGLYPKMTFTPFVHTYTDLISNQKYYDKLVSQGIQLKIKVPLRYLGKHFYHYYTPFLEGKIVQQNSQIGEKTQILSYMPLQLGGEAIVFSPMCKRDIANKWLLKTTLVYGKTMDKNFDESLFYGQVQGNVPSLWKHHVIRTTFSYEKLQKQSVLFQNKTRMPRGYLLFMPSSEVTALFVDYIFPIAYPDKGGWFAYFQRLKANVFFDYAQMATVNYSYGMELTANTNLFRYSYLMDIGVRISKPQNRAVVFEPLFSISF